MATVYTLNASSCPALVIPGALLAITGEVPTTFTALVAGASGSGALVSPSNKNAVRSDNLGRGGAGAWAVDWDSGPSSSTPGLNITNPAGLTARIGTGQAIMDGPVQVTANQDISCTDNIARIYLWLGTDGVVRAVNNSTTPPATPTGAQVFLGSVVTSAGAVTEINGSGVLYYRGSHLTRQTADTACPSDTPPSGLSFFNVCPGGVFFWDGSQYQNLTNSGRAALTFASDANKTLTTAEATNAFLDFGGGGTALTATRNVVLPHVQGRLWRVRNASNGGQSLQFIGSSGTGITVGTGKVATVQSDGTNVIRITADL